MSKTDLPLTRSGLGAVLEGADAHDAQTLERAVMERGICLGRAVDLTDVSFRNLVARLGNTVTYEDEASSVGYGYKDILHLNGSSDGKIISGRGPLPLHTDGLLVNRQVDLIIWYAVTAQQLGDDGATVICDQIAAWREMPRELLEVIDAGSLEYFGVERGYFTNVPTTWFPIPTIRDFGRVRSLNISLPFEDGAPTSWQVRVPGKSESESRAWFGALREHLTQERYIYTHRWQPGDLVIVDNQRTLHGRLPLRDGARRILMRGQVTLQGPMQRAEWASADS